MSPCVRSVSLSVPGCGNGANACIDPADACALDSTFCGCNGVTITGGCGFATQPFASEGECPEAAAD